MESFDLQQQAELYLKQDQFQEAIALYQQAIDHEPTHLRLYWQLGIALVLQGNLEEAQAVWLSALIEAETPDTEITTLVAILVAEAHQRLQTHQFEQAERLYRQALEQVPDRLDAQQGLAITLIQQNRFAEAIVLLQTHSALTTQPDAFNRLTTSRYGTVLYNIYDEIIGRSVSCYGEFSQGELDLFEQFIQPGNVVLDVGANIGTHTLFFAQKVGESGAVFAFEPQRIIFQTLCANVALNSLTNVYTYCAAIGSQQSSIKIPFLDYRNSNNFGGIPFAANTEGEEVPMMAIDDLNLVQCDFIKVDVEGMERSVLESAMQTIHKFKPILYVEYDPNYIQGETSDLANFIASLGYALKLHTPPFFNPNNYFRKTDNIFGTIASHNLLCLPQ